MDTLRKRTIVYIDGFNLYYGLLRFTCFKWLDVVAFADALLPHPELHDIASVKYFTARVNYDPLEPMARMRQEIYLSALSAYRPDLRIIEGYYRRFRARYPFSKEPCKSCGKVPFATVWKTEEKRSDVNMASQMFIDHIETAFDCIVLVSGDSDLVAPLHYLKKQTGKTVLVFNPHERPSEDLRAVSSYYAHIPRDLPASCQLPDVVALPNGRPSTAPRRGLHPDLPRPLPPLSPSLRLVAGSSSRRRVESSISRLLIA